MTDLVTIGFKADASGIENVNKSFDKVVTGGAKVDNTLKRTEKSVNNLNKASSAGSDKMSMFGRQSGQAGIQLQQFIGQVQGGQSAMLALSQQSADLGFVLGAPLVGAIVGIGASMAGLLLPNLLKSTDATSDLEKAMKLLSQTATDNNGVKIFTKDIEELAKVSEKSAKLMILAAEQAAKDAGRAAATGIGEEFNKAFDVTFFQANFDALKRIAGTALGTGHSISKEYEDLGKQFGLTGADARNAGITILKSLREMEDAVSTGVPDAGEKIIAFREQLLKLTESASGTSQEKLLRFVNSMSDYISKAEKAAEMSKLFKEAVAGGKLPTGTTIKHAEALDAITKSLESQIIALDKGEQAALRYEIAQKLELKTVEEIPKALDDQITRYFQLVASKKELTSETSNLVRSLKEQEQQLLLDADAFELYSAKMRAIARKDSPEQIAAIMGQIKINQLLRKEMELIERETQEMIKEETKAFKEVNKIAEESAKRLDSAFADVWINMFDGFQSVVDGIKRAFQRLLAELAHAAISRPILISMGLGGSADALAGGFGGLGGLGAAASGSAFSSGIGGTMSLLGAGSMSGAMANIQGLFASGNYMASIGAALPVAAIAAAAGIAVNKITGGKLFGSSFKEKDRMLSLGLAGGALSGSTTLTETKERSLFRGTKTRTTATGFDTSSLSGVFDAMGDAIKNAASIFGFDDAAESFLGGFNASLKTSIKGKSEEEVQQIINDWAVKTSGAMVSGVFGSFVEELAIEGEDLSQTLGRLSANLQVVKDITKSIGLSFDLTGEAAARASTNIVNLTGGLEQFTNLSRSYYENFFTDQERFNNLQSDLIAAFGEIGVPLATTVSEFRALVDGLDLTTEAGQEMFAALMNLNPAMTQYINALDAAADAVSDLANSAFKDLEAAVDAEKDRIKSVLDGAKEIYRAEIQRINETRNALEESFDMLTGKLSDAKDAMTSAFDAQKQSIIDASNLRIDNIRLEMDASREYHNIEMAFLSEQKKATSDMISGLSGASSNLRGFAGVDTNALSNDLARALTSARMGNFNPAMALGDISALRANPENFQTAAQMRVSQGVTGFRADELANLVDSQLSVEERTLSAIEKQVTDEVARFETEQSLLESRIEKEEAFQVDQIKALDAQLNAVLGISENTLSIDESIIAFQKAQQELNDLDYDRMLESLALQESWAMDALDQAEESHDEQVKALDNILMNGRAELNALYNVNASVLSVADAVKQLQITVQNAEAAQAARDLQIAKQSRKSADSLQQIVIDGVQTTAVV